MNITKRTQTEKLTDALLADRNRGNATHHNIVSCWSCGHTFKYKGRRGDLNGNFCSMRCQQWFDDGNPPITEQRRTAHGFEIKCAACSKDFESKGLRCCSDNCERRYVERQRNLEIMAEVGIEPAAKKRCAAPDCTNTIPKWRNGRRVSSTTRFCSDRCSRRAKLAA